MNFTVSGIREAGICVRAAKPWLDLFTGAAGWKLVAQGETPSSTRALWPDHGQNPVRETLLQRPAEEFGLVRLFQFSGVGQVDIRAGMMPWDSGGIFDLDVRVDDLNSWHQRLVGLGWGGIHPPVDWKFGDLSIREWLAVGPEAVVLALIQRLKPALEGPAVGTGFGHVFNSSQIVANMRSAVSFYELLGFKTIVSHYGPLEGGGGAVLGLEADVLETETVELVIMHPQAQMQGSVELVCLPSRKGGRADDLALPYNLGLNLLRFEVSGIKALAGHLSLRPGGFLAGPADTHLSSIGPVRMLATRSPDGAWLEFFERL